MLIAQAHRLSIDCLYSGIEKIDGSEAGQDLGGSKFSEVFRRLAELEAHVFSTRATSDVPGTLERPIQNVRMSPHDVVEPRDWTLSPGTLRSQHVAFMVWGSVFKTLKENNTSIESVGQKYFAHTQKWIPMISHTRFAEGQAGGGNERFPLLVLTMHLIVTPYSEHPPTKLISDSPWYRAAKHHFGQYVALVEPSLELVQAGLLIALFEHTQCVASRATITLGVCGTLAHALDLENSSIQESIPVQEEMSPEKQEMALTWWSLFLLERQVPYRPLLFYSATDP